MLLPPVATRTEWATNAKLDEATVHQNGSAARTPFLPVLRVLQQAFDQPFSLIDTETGDLVYAAPNSLNCDLFGRVGLIAEVAQRGHPEIIEDVSPLLMLAIPLRPLGQGATHVAIGVFAYQQVEKESEIAAAACAFGVDAKRTLQWIRQQEVWPVKGLLRFADTTMQGLVQRGQIAHLQYEINEAVAHARDTYVELGLLHRLTRHLRVSGCTTELWQQTLAWLAEAVPAQCLAIVPNSAALKDNEQPTTSAPIEILVQGEPPLKADELEAFVLSLGSELLKRPLVLNRADTSLPIWKFATVREFACVPIVEGKKTLGWMIALNHKGNLEAGLGEFGSVETRLLSSVSTILGIHSNNTSLFQQQTELFAGSIQTLTSAIDAKDGYISGHSERTARISVHLAREMGCTDRELSTIYLAGLLHDIGKIGIEDKILKKPDTLTTEEYEHIKLHAEFGYDILKGVRQLDSILPVVLHHHEAWNGNGYPHGLVGEDTPLLARIVAVADAYDAMSSSRPYREGMPDEEFDKILREGAGKQWDPDVIDAFFKARDEIRKVSNSIRQGISLDFAEWLI